MLVGMVTVWLTPEPGGVARPRRCPATAPSARVEAWLKRAVVAPFRDMFAARRGGCWRSCRSSCSTNSATRSPARWRTRFMSSLGFTKVEVATIAKVYGVVATLAGRRARRHPRVAARGLPRAPGLRRAAGAVEPDVCAQLWAGHDVAMLAVTIGGREPDRRHGARRRLSPTCRGCAARDFTATQYALLSSLATVGLNVLVASGG